MAGSNCTVESRQRKGSMYNNHTLPCAISVNCTPGRREMHQLHSRHYALSLSSCYLCSDGSPHNRPIENCMGL